MDPSKLIVWALCIGVAWLILASLTGVDDWLKSLFGKTNSHDLEQRIQELEKRVNELSKK
jgi:sensor domain CHASE-containing protein